MKKWNVAVTVSIEMYYTVEAETEQEAKDKAEELACTVDFGGKLIDDVNAWSVEESEDM